MELSSFALALAVFVSVATTAVVGEYDPSYEYARLDNETRGRVQKLDAKWRGSASFDSCLDDPVLFASMWSVLKTSFLDECIFSCRTSDAFMNVSRMLETQNNQFLTSATLPFGCSPKRCQEICNASPLNDHGHVQGYRDSKQSGCICVKHDSSLDYHTNASRRRELDSFDAFRMGCDSESNETLIFGDEKLALRDRLRTLMVSASECRRTYHDCALLVFYANESLRNLQKLWPYVPETKLSNLCDRYTCAETCRKTFDSVNGICDPLVSSACRCLLIDFAEPSIEDRMSSFFLRPSFALIGDIPYPRTQDAVTGFRAWRLVRSWNEIATTCYEAYEKCSQKIL